jgi:hypothetical protein
VARPDADDPIDGLLARTLSARGDMAGDVCPEPDLLAAFVDGAVDRGTRERIEQHAASCTRCAHVLALTVSAEPVASTPSPASSFWTVMRSWRFAAPFATAAIVVGIWLAATQTVNSPEFEVSQSRTVTSAQSEPGAVPDSAASLPRGGPRRTANFEASADARTAGELAGKAESPTRDVARGDRTMELSVPRPPAAPTPVPLPVPSSQARLSELPPDDAPLEKRRNDREAADPSSASAVTAPRAERFAAQSAAPLASAAPGTDAVLVRGPDSGIIWRARGRFIEQSADGGATWAPVFMTSQALTGGAAAGSDAVWFFARGGLVVRRSQTGWTESTAPGPIGSLQPASATRATIRLTDGRVFTTVDGGVTWREESRK